MNDLFDVGQLTMLLKSALENSTKKTIHQQNVCS